MPRRFLLILAAIACLARFDLAPAQDMSTATSAAADATAPAGDDITALKAENAALKKEVSDAKTTIAELQAKLAQAGGTQPAATAATAVTGVVPDVTAPSGPQKALPLDATNIVSTPGAPATDAGPSKSYTVVKGDSLWKIAHKMYPGDTKNGVDKLTEANKDTIAGKPLKIGQVLIVPQ